MAIPERTMRSWYSGHMPLLVASGRYRDFALLLAFIDLEEAHKVHLLLTKYGFSFTRLRRALLTARRRTKSSHPLIGEHIKVFFDELALDRPARGKLGRRVMALKHAGAPAQMIIPEVFDLFAKSIIFDKRGNAAKLLPWRYETKRDESTRPVAIDPHVMSGRLVVIGTRIPVQVLWRRKLSGESHEDLAKDYRISVDLVQNALMHIDKNAKKAA